MRFNQSPRRKQRDIKRRNATTESLRGVHLRRTTKQSQNSRLLCFARNDELHASHAAIVQSVRLFSFLAGLLLIVACGYQFVGRASTLPPEIRKIAVPTFENATFEPLLDERLTEEIKKGFLGRPRLQVVNSVAEADAVLKGKITAFRLIPLSFDPQNEAAEYRVKILADFALQDARDQKILWQEKMMETTAEYFVIQDLVDPTRVDIARTRDAEDRAIVEAAKVLAENLISQILGGFPSH